MKLHQPHKTGSSAVHFFLTVLFGLMLGATADATSVVQVKGTKALISLDGMQAQPGTELYAINAEQKRKGLLRVTQVKGDKAVADILQGIAQPGMMIIIKSSTPTNVAPAAPPAYSSDPAYGNYGSTDRYTRAKKYTKGWGAYGGMAMNSMAVTAKGPLGQSENLSMKGNSYNLKGFFDYHMSSSFTLRGATGLETLALNGSVADTSLCSGSGTCTLSLNYITFEGDAQLNLATTPHRFWLGAGFGFLLAMSTANNITSLQASSTNQVLLLGAGADFAVGKTAYIPVVLEYGMFPFAGISLSSIYLRAGYGMKF